MKKDKLTLGDLKVSTFQTSPESIHAKGGAIGGTITDCLCSETFWLPCDCSGDHDNSDPYWVCQDQRY